MTFELNTKDTASWIKEKMNMSGFLVNMGSTTDFKEQTFGVIMDWVPTTLDVTTSLKLNGFRTVEFKSLYKLSTLSFGLNLSV